VCARAFACEPDREVEGQIGKGEGGNKAKGRPVYIFLWAGNSCLQCPVATIFGLFPLKSGQGRNRNAWWGSPGRPAHLATRSRGVVWSGRSLTRLAPQFHTPRSYKSWSNRIGCPSLCNLCTNICYFPPNSRADATQGQEFKLEHIC
jgi:hypothetical protein